MDTWRKRYLPKLLGVEMSDDHRWLVNWKAALAVGIGGAAAVAGIAAVTYKIREWRKERRRTVPVPGESPEASESEPVEPTGPAPSANGGFVALGKPDLPKSAHERAMNKKQEGNELYKAQKYMEAVECYKQALELCPEKEDDISKLYQNIGAAYAVMASQATDQGKKTEHLLSVVDYCSRALELNRRYMKALTRRQKAYEQLGRKRDAFLDVTRIVILDETQGRILADTITTLLKEIGKEQAAIEFASLGPLAPTNYIIKTYFESFVWNDDLSEEGLRELWESHKQDSEGSDGQSTELSDEDPFFKAAAMFREKQYHGIIEALSEAIEKGCPVFLPHALLLRGTFYITWRDNAKALDDLDAVITTAGASKMLVINALVKKATIYAGIPEMEKVKECFDRCLQLEEACPDVLIHKARVQLESPEDVEDMKAVIEGLKKAISLAPQSAYALYSLATAYHRLAGMSQSEQILGEAINTFNKAYGKFPEYGDGLVLYAMCLQDVSQIGKAKDILTKAAKMDPDNPSVYLSLGMAAMLSSEPAKAKAQFQKATEVDNSCVQAYDTLASLELQAGNSQGALDLYHTSIRFARSQTELSQVLVAREVISAQHQACKEYGISVKDLMARVLQSPLM